MVLLRCVFVCVFFSVRPWTTFLSGIQFRFSCVVPFLKNSLDLFGALRGVVFSIFAVVFFLVGKNRAIHGINDYSNFDFFFLLFFLTRLRMKTLDLCKGGKIFKIFWPFFENYSRHKKFLSIFSLHLVLFG